MTTFLEIHPQKPQPRLVRQAVATLRQNGLIVYPTDSYYALGCLQDNAAGIDRARALRGLGKSHNFALLCRDIGQIGDYGAVSNAAFRMIKARTPGPYTFILPAGKRVARRLYHPSRKTVAFRASKHPVAQALLEESGEAIVTTTLKLANDAEPLASDYLRERLKGLVDLIIDSGPCDMTPTTVLDFTETPPRLLREGGGEVVELG